MTKSRLPGRGPELTGEKRPRPAVLVGGQATRGAQPDDLCGLSRPSSGDSTLNPQLPIALRVALVDGDESAHDFVRQTFKAHASGWVLDSYLTAHSVLSAFGSMPAALPRASATPHFVGGEAPSGRGIPNPNAQRNELSTPPTINQHLPTAQSHLLPDVVLMETQLPDLCGIECARRLTASLPRARIVMFTTCSEHNRIVESVMRGIWGYLIKPAAPGHLVRVVSEAAQGRRALCSEAQVAAMDYIRRSGATGRSATLSWREREVMLRVMDGIPNKVIAAELNICEGTVHRHLNTIYKKLKVHGKEEARRKFME